jgi:glyoxylase-like metal-dependent hydrolase (beta-lactamase superfamily II)
MTVPIAIGDIRITVVSGGRLRIDGGNMFGVIPRALWARQSPPDEQHRILLDTNCFLVHAPDSLGLIDAGYGGKINAKLRHRHELEDGEPLVRNLAVIGVAPEEIDWVILTHLHFDHAGGVTRQDEGGNLRPTFPRARHFVQRIEWEDALSDLPELAGAYNPDDFELLEAKGLLELLDGDSAIASGVSTQLTGAHTRGHQIVRIESEKDSAVCLADLCPTTAHLRTFWTMAYDQFPLDVRRKKPPLLKDVSDHRRIALFAHDAHVAAARLFQESENEWSAAPLRTSCL